MRARSGLAALACVLGLALVGGAAQAQAEPVLPSGFQDTTLPFEGLTSGEGLEEPTAFRFAPDGKVFVAEKSGKILVFDSLSDHTPTFFADLRTEIYNGADRGLLGLAIDPQFSVLHPYVYVLYSYDHELGDPEPPPRWGEPGADGESCPDPPGTETDGCPISGRLSRLTVNLATDHMVSEEPLITDWCQQFSSHSIGDLQFDSEGNLWASGGDGASFTKVDWGQYGYPEVNPCGDPPAGVGGLETPPDAEGGALRSQNPKRLNGKLIRIDPETGEGVPGNPLFGSLDANERRIVGKGFRNPFRFAIDASSGEVYVDNVGSSEYEEIDRVKPSSSQVFNSGWPCYEGPEPNELYAPRGLRICDDLYAQAGSTAQPFFYYAHHAGVTPSDQCPYGPGSAISGLAFYEGSHYPESYDGALFFSDSVRGCLYVMRPGEDGHPDPSAVEPFLTEGGLYPGVDIEVGPEGDLFYASLYAPNGGEEYGPGAIHRITYDPDAPRARLTSDRVSGPAPLLVHFDASGSTDPQGEGLEYEWDLDGNGTFGAPTTSATATETYVDGSANKTASVRVSDENGHTSVAQITVYPGDSPPHPEIAEPADGLRWGVGDAIHFKGSGTDGKGDPLAASHLYWRSRLYHCPGGPDSCHAHPLQVFPAVEEGTLVAPDHDLPSHIELALTATDGRGLSATETVNLDPNVAVIDIRSNPSGLILSGGLQTQATPFGVEAIEGSMVSLSAPASVDVGGATYAWREWSDCGAREHAVLASGVKTYEAIYSAGGAGAAGGAGTACGPKLGPPPPESPRLPRTLLKKHPGKRTRNTTARFSFAADEAGATFRCKLDQGSYRRCRSPLVYRGLEPGGHVFVAYAIDPTGNADPSPIRFRWRIQSRCRSGRRGRLRSAPPAAGRAGPYSAASRVCQVGSSGRS